MTFLSEFIPVLSLYTANTSSWVYLADWILALILGLAFVFYFNRLVGFLISQLLRLIIWKYLKVHVTVQSFRVSFLGGRVFAKNVVIIGPNETLSILQLNFTWRYWIFNYTRRCEYLLNASESDSDTIKENSQYPTRFVLLIEGLEHYIYNRTVAYDSILDFLSKEELKNSKLSTNSSNPLTTSYRLSATQDSACRHRGSSSSAQSSLKDERDNANESTKAPSPKNSSILSAAAGNAAAEASLKNWLKFFPLSIRIKKGALVVGNSSTPTVVVSSFHTAEGIIDVSKSPCSLDVYRQVFNFQLERFSIVLKPNYSYKNQNKQPIEKNSGGLSNGVSGNNLKHRRKYKVWFKFQKSLDKFFNKSLRRLTNNKFGKDFNEQNEQDFRKNWRGLRRYVGDILDEDITPQFNSDEEYAKYSLVLDSASTRLAYYFDMPGIIPRISESHIEYPAPEFGVEVELSMATIHYGAWTDKQRIPLQSMLFPTLYRDTEPTEASIPGTTRTYKGFDFFVHVKDECIFRIPTREQSKDLASIKNFQQSQQKKHRHHHHHHRHSSSKGDKSENVDDSLIQSSSRTGIPSRSFGWLEMKMEAGSNIFSHTSYIANKENGWPNTLDLQFMKPELRSSVNHDILFTADSHSIASKVGFPLSWNAKCNWDFHNVSKNAKIFFLREHTMLISDILTDFGSGVPTPYEFLRSYHYQFNWKFLGYKLYMNINDANIIDNPIGFENNKFLSFQGDDLDAEISIPINTKFSKSNTVNYKILTTFFELILDTPPWHTTNAFMQQTKLMGRANYFTIDGSYTYFSTVEINTSDHVVIDMKGDYVTLKCYGFIVRYLMSIRENYFGDHVHFKTFEEYSQENDMMDHNSDTSSLSSSETSSKQFGDGFSTNSTSSDISYWNIGRAENDIDVLFAFKVRHGLCLLPCNLYDSRKHVGLLFDSLDVDIRFTNYYMDMQCDISPISGILVDQDDDISLYNSRSEIIFDIPKYSKSYLKKPNIIIDGLSVHGHRMFGLPPVEPTYYCKWDIAIESIDIDSDGKFLTGLVSSVEGLGVGYLDLENELVVHIPTLYDVTCFSFSCPKIHVALHHDIDGSSISVDSDSTFHIEITSLLFAFNDLANDRYSSKLSVIIPSVKLNLVKKVGGNERTLLFSDFPVNISNICQKRKFLDHRRKQQHHVRTNDAPFHRCPFLLYPVERDDVYMEALGCFMTSLTLPNVAIPMNRDSAQHIFDDEYSSATSDFERDSSRSWDSYSSSSSSFSSIKSSNHIKPTTEYNTADFCPQYDVDPRYEYDNFIIDINIIDVYLSPRALLPIAKILQTFQNPDITSCLDALQVSMLLKVMLLIKPGNSHVHTRFVTLEIILRIGDFDAKDPEDLSKGPIIVPHLKVAIVEPSLAFSNRTTRIKESLNDSDSLRITSEISGAVHVKEILFSASNPLEFVVAASIDVENIEFWFNKTPSKSEKEITSSHTVDKIDVSIASNQAQWLLNYILKTYDIVEPSIIEFEKFADYGDNYLSELVYLLAKAGKDYHIDDDPGVLTKPAYVLRSCADHMRFHDSWKLMTRIRHIFDNLPENWKTEVSSSMKNHVWSSPKTANEDFLSIFSRWRTWEVSDVEQSYLYKQVFEKYISEHKGCNIAKDLALFANFSTDLINVSFNIKDENNKTIDFIELDSVSFTLGVNSARAVDLSTIGVLGTLDILQKLEGIFNINIYKSKISTVSLDLVPMILNMQKAMESKSKKQKEPPEAVPIKNHDCPFDINKFISVIANIKSYRQQIILPYTSVELRGNSVSCSAQSYLLANSKLTPFTVSLIGEAVELDVWGQNQMMANSMEDLYLLLGNFGTLERGVKYAKVEISKISVYLSEQETSFVKALSSIIDIDLPYIQNLVQFENEEHEKNVAISSSASIKTSSPFKSIYSIVGDTFLDFNLGDLNWSLDVLYPLTISGKVVSSRLTLNITEKATYADLALERFDSIFSIERKTLARFENSDIKTKVKFVDSSIINLAVCSMKIGFTRVLLPQFAQSLELALKNMEVLDERVRALENIGLKLSSNEPSNSNTPKKMTKEKETVFKFNFSNEYIGVSTFLERSKLSYELEGFSFGVHNVASVTKDDKSTHCVVPLFGELLIPTARISILDRSIPVGLSNVFEFNVTLKVMNNTHEFNSPQSLQLESQYCRICGSPQVLFKILELVDVIVVILSNFPIPNLRENKIKNGDEIKSENVDKGDSFKLPFVSINILSYNFCIGWLFGDTNIKSYPGIILGAERFFAVVEETVGKFTLMEAYLSVANGSRSSNFFSSLSEKTNLNRAYMPTMQITYVVEKFDSAKNLKLNIYGDELDVKFLSDSIVLIEKAVKSGSKIQAFFNNRESPQQAPAKNVVKKVEDKENDIFRLFFSSIECVYYFAGSNILFYRFNDGNNNYNAPSFYLHSPAVKVATMYKHNKDLAIGSKEKKHVLKIEVLTSPFDNVLYAYCVPVILDIVQGVKRMMRSDPTSLPKNNYATTTSVSDFKLGDLLKDVDLHFGLRIEKQKLSLSCEPTAKVEAVVAIGGINFQINSLVDSSNALTSIIQFESLSSTLQHVYSREISGSIAIENIILTSKINFKEVTSILSAGSFSKISGYVNAKQFQDLKLFKDIWLPKEYLEDINSYDTTEYDWKKEDRSNKNLTERVKEVSTTYAVPWDLTLILTDITLQVDFGQSLGNFKLSSNKIWAVSHKTTDWAQDLKVGLDNISLTLKGRLGGTLDINRINLHAGISWKIDGGTILDVPLIILSGEIGSLQLKSSFDHHVFALANIKSYSIDIFNKKNEVTTLNKDHLYITTKFERAEIYVTSFAASNVMDIYNTVFRMVQENKNSYSEILRDSRKSFSGANTKGLPSMSTADLDPRKQFRRDNNLDSPLKSMSNQHDVLSSFTNPETDSSKKLVSKIEVITGHVLIHIYPSSFDDNKVLVVKLDGAQVNFDENGYEDGIANDLKVQFNGLKVALSKSSSVLEDFISSATVDEFVKHAYTASGGTIFVFPSFRISMKTFQKYDSNVIEYFYQSSFGGTVGIRWNLGSVNFIREMFAIHTRALASRTSYKKNNERKIPHGSAIEDGNSIKEDNLSPLDKPTVEDYDTAINATIDKVSDDSKYIYQALAAPIIEAPQLKELGNATPPLEWFGLHREKFPNVTHQLGIVSLQKVIGEIEAQYSKVLGKA